MYKKIISIITLQVLFLMVEAHEFWIQPDKFKFNIGETLTLNFKVGENFMGENWDLKKTRLEKLQLHKKNKIQDLKQIVKEGEKENIKVALGVEGTHLVVMQSNDASISLDGEKFNEYLKEDGLDDAYAEREKTNTLQDSAKELYSRHTKLLIQVGKTTDDTFKKVVGLPIEIIPERNPYTLKVGDPVRFKILYNGKPLFGAKVKVWNRHNNRTTMQNIYSQQDGMIETHISNPGAWMVSVVKMVPSKEAKADWQSYWGSLVFGIQ